MPKIIIKEYDNTTAVSGLYSNFAVLVPGVVRPRTTSPDKNGNYKYGGMKVSETKNAESVFDINGVCKFESQDDFVNTIGRVSASQGQTLKNATRISITESDKITFTLTPAVAGVKWNADDANELTTAAAAAGKTTNDPKDPEHPDGDKFSADEVALGQLYTAFCDAHNGTAPTANDWKVEPKDAVTARQKYINCVLGLGTNQHLYFIKASSDLIPETSGYCYDSQGNKYEQVDKKSAADLGWQTQFETTTTGGTKQFAVLADDELGADADVGAHYGNQMAYELLGLGYTVLYKQITIEDIPNLTQLSWWAPLKDKSLYDFRYVVSGFLDGTSTINKILTQFVDFINRDADKNTNNGRGDCTALLDIPASAYTGRNNTQSAAISGIRTYLNSVTSSKYAAYFAPWVEYNLVVSEEYDNLGNIDDEKAYKTSVLPSSFHYLACAAKTAERFNEWYAVAGYQRGICNLPIKAVGCRFGEEAINALQPRYKNDTNNLNVAANLITSIKGSYYLWGNRTAFELGQENTKDGNLRASHYLNIRQLCNTIKKQLYITCRKYTFDPNSDILWANFCADLRPLLEKMKGDQGIEDYKFIKIKTAQKAMLKAKIRIVPVYAVEDFDISLTLEDSIAGLVATVDEDEE